jgi:hypothetical protein
MWARRSDGVSPHETLHCLLKLHSTSSAIIVECLSCIRVDIINGRCAIYCISEIQQHLLALYGDTPYIENREKDYLLTLFKTCTEPFLDLSSADYPRCPVLLEVIPTIFAVFSKKGGSASSSRRDDTVKSMIKSILASVWPRRSHVLLLNLTIELNRYMKRSDMKKLQVLLLTFCTVCYLLSSFKR